MTAPSLKKKLKDQELTIGSWITIGHPSIAEIMGSAGFDWLTVDLEHSVISLEQAQTLFAIIKSKGMYALARVPKNEEVVIKKVMDAGADGIIVPMVNSAEQAKMAVDYVHYPPVGKRGVGLARAQQYGIGFSEYKEWLSTEAVVIAQVEHIDSVNNIEAIIATPGIDGVLIGPYDLSGSLGLAGELEHPLVLAAIQKVRKACLDAKVPLGFHVISPEHHKLQEKIDDGFTFLGFSLDFHFLGEKARVEMSALKRK